VLPCYILFSVKAPTILPTIFILKLSAGRAGDDDHQRQAARAVAGQGDIDRLTAGKGFTGQGDRSPRAKASPGKGSITTGRQHAGDGQGGIDRLTAGKDFAGQGMTITRGRQRAPATGREASTDSLRVKTSPGRG